jgi:hypothetical protein
MKRYSTLSIIVLQSFMIEILLTTLKLPLTFAELSCFEQQI